MIWAVIGIAVLVALLLGVTFGFRDVPPPDRSKRETPILTKTGILEDAWRNVDDHFRKRKKIGR